MSDTTNSSTSSRRTLWQRIRGLLGGKEPSLKQSVEEAIEEHEASGATTGRKEKKLLRNVLAFNELEVKDVMIPAADIVAVEYSTSLKDLQTKLSGKTHTRLPVYRGTMDDILGFVHIKDIAHMIIENKDFSMKDLLRKSLFVPPSMKIHTLLVRMQMLRVHMALVIDEYGGTVGLVTLEDVVEEIVGEIEDEHDIAESIIFQKVGPKRYEVGARMGLQELEVAIGLPLSDVLSEEADTLGGLIFHSLGHVPAVGEVAVFHLEETPYRLECEVVEADLRRIHRVMVYVHEEEENDQREEA